MTAYCDKKKRSSSEWVPLVGMLATLFLVCCITLNHQLDTSRTEVDIAPGAVPQRHLLGEKEANDFRKWNKEIPRHNKAGEKIINTFLACDGDVCSTQEYAESLVVIAAPAIALAALLVFFFICWLILRHLCNSCGGKEPSLNRKFPLCCIPDRSAPFSGYTHYQVQSTWVCLTILVLGVFSGFVLGYVGNTDFSNGYNSFVDVVLEQGQNILDSANSIYDSAGELTGVMNQSDLQPMVEAAQDIADVANGAEGTVRKVDTAREATTHIALILCFILALVAIIGAFFKRGWPAYLMAMIAFLLTAVMWAAFGLHLASGVMLADLCDEIDVQLLVPGDVMRGNTRPAINKLIPCEGEAFDDAVDTLTTAQTQAISSACVFFNDYKNGPGAETAKAANAFDEITTDQWCFDVTNTRSILELPLKFGAHEETVTWDWCFRNCRDEVADEAETKQKLEQIIPPVRDVVTVNDMLSEVTLWKDCTYIKTSLTAARDPMCIEMMSGTYYLIVATCMIAILYTIFGIPYGIMGLKRLSDRFWRSKMDTESSALTGAGGTQMKKLYSY